MENTDLKNFKHGVLYFDIQLRDEFMDEDLASDDAETVEYAQNAVKDTMQLEFDAIQEMIKIVGPFTTEGHGHSDELICRLYVGNIDKLREVWTKLESRFESDQIDFDSPYMFAGCFAFYPDSVNDLSYGTAPWCVGDMDEILD